MEPNATLYFCTLAGVLARMQATDARGVTLGLDVGAQRAAALLRSARAGERKVMVIGNGGSAAIAAHLHNDLSKTVGVRSLAFLDGPLMTALTNDLGYEHVYEEPIRQWARTGDVLIAISSSGQSENILRGVEAAIAAGASVVSFSGFEPDNPLRRLGQVNFYVPSMQYGLVEVAHQALAHYLTDAAAALSLPPQAMTPRSQDHDDERITTDIAHRWGRVRRLRPGAQTAEVGPPGESP